MFETAELGRKVSKEDFNAKAPALREKMVTLQQDLRKLDFPVIIVFGGVDGAGKSETVNLLNEWMDPRWILTSAYGEPSDEESERPEFWRYWRDLPPKGQIGLFLSAWYSQPLRDRVNRRIGKARYDEKLTRIRLFERMLVDDGALILKFWMHLDKASQKKRLSKLEKHPTHHWKVTKNDWSNFKKYDRFIESGEQLIARTSTSGAPWTIVEGNDDRYRSLTVLTHIHDAVRAHQEARVEAHAERKTEMARAKRRKQVVLDKKQPSLLSSLDMSQAIDKEEYSRLLQKQRARLHGLYRKAREEKISTVLVFEGWDAGGKGGAIRRLSSALDARDVRVLPFAAPNDEERQQHYLWRFWRRIARAGRFTIFDRSWYGRLLVERIEHFATPSEWQRAFAEINEFESQLTDHGTVVLKFWLHIDKDEQERRFTDRKNTPYKAWKLTEEDWRNREQWDTYEAAVVDMIERTSTRNAPWVLVEGNDKRFARLKIIETVCAALEQRMDIK